MGRRHRDELNLALATAGLVLAAVGASLPWARIGGRGRSGFDTADTFIALSDGVLPDSVAWVGRWWYVPAFLVLVAWASVFTNGHPIVRAAGVAFVLVGVAMWWLFVWAGAHWNLLNTRTRGPAVATVGMALVAIACARRRRSMLDRGSAGPSSRADERAGGGPGDGSPTTREDRAGTLFKVTDETKVTADE